LRDGRKKLEPEVESGQRLLSAKLDYKKWDKKYWAREGDGSEGKAKS